MCTYIEHRKLIQDAAEFFVKGVLGELDLAHIKFSNATYLKVSVDNLFAADDSAQVRWGCSVRTVGVLRCVLERTISRKSFAVGTGAMALSPLVDIVGRDQDFFLSVSSFLIGK